MNANTKIDIPHGKKRLTIQPRRKCIEILLPVILKYEFLQFQIKELAEKAVNKQFDKYSSFYRKKEGTNWYPEA